MLQSLPNQVDHSSKTIPLPVVVKKMSYILETSDSVQVFVLFLNQTQKELERSVMPPRLPVGGLQLLGIIDQCS